MKLETRITVYTMSKPVFIFLNRMYFSICSLHLYLKTNPTHAFRMMNKAGGGEEQVINQTNFLFDLSLCRAEQICCSPTMAQQMHTHM